MLLGSTLDARKVPPLKLLSGISSVSGKPSSTQRQEKKLEVTENQVMQEQHAGGCMWMPSSFLFAVNSFYFCISRAV